MQKQFILIGKTILFIALMIGANPISADPCIFTVLAKSGLHLRVTPDINGEKLTTIPFGTLLSTKEGCTYYHKKKNITIDGLKGFWLAVDYGEVQGFVFSAYIVDGDLFQNARNDSLEYSIIEEYYNNDWMDEEERTEGFDIRNYSPNLNWYGLLIEKGKSHLIPVDLQLEVDYAAMPANYRSRYDAHLIKLKVSPEKPFRFLLGSKKPIPAGEINAMLIPDITEKASGRYVFPSETFSFSMGNKHYNLKAYENLSPYEAKTLTGLDRSYQLDLFLYQEHIADLDQLLELWADGERHTLYQNPALFWVGDLNGDKHADLIFHVDPMGESCSSISYFQLLLSDTGDQVKYQGLERMYMADFR